MGGRECCVGEWCMGERGGVWEGGSVVWGGGWGGERWGVRGRECCVGEWCMGEREWCVEVRGRVVGRGRRRKGVGRGKKGWGDEEEGEGAGFIQGGSNPPPSHMRGSERVRSERK